MGESSKTPVVLLTGFLGSGKTTLLSRLLGDPAGVIKRDPKGKVKHSDACPGCGRKFADTIALRADPQQRLF